MVARRRPSPHASHPPSSPHASHPPSSSQIPPDPRRAGAVATCKGRATGARSGEVRSSYSGSMDAPSSERRGGHHISSYPPKFSIWSGGQTLPQAAWDASAFVHRMRESTRCWRMHRTWAASALGEIRRWRKGPRLARHSGVTSPSAGMDIWIEQGTKNFNKSASVMSIEANTTQTFRRPGSDSLERRLRAIHNNAKDGAAWHVLGHTHFCWDYAVDNIRYVQAPLAYPRERNRRINGGQGWLLFFIYRDGFNPEICPAIWSETRTEGSLRTLSLHHR
ncbi:hypothetical protein ACQJBY_049030 [Aegilops geniculata]